MKIAIITGASSGMGRDFARAVAQKWDVDALWLIARRAARLETLAGELDRPARILPLDLTEPESIRVFGDLLEAEKPEISVLVNAAGFGVFAHETEIPLKTQLEMADVNVKALTAFCALSIPYMARGSAIVNLGSLSSFQPVPYINVYGATKAYVLSFSRALNVELRERGIRVIAVCPGWVETEFFDRARSGNGAVTYYNKMWRSEDVVKKTLQDLEKRRDVSILGASVRLQTLLTKLLPHRLVMRIWMKQQKH